MVTKQRASHDEIMQHLSALLGFPAAQVACQSAKMILAGNQKAGFKVLTDFDAALGGVGVYVIKDNRALGVYRAIFYVYLPLHREHPEDHTRTMIHSACSYLEELLKKMVRVWPWELIKEDTLPLGTLANRIQKKIPVLLADDLLWLSRSVYNFAKHHFNFEEEDQPESGHYIELDETLAVYLIVRKLGLDLEKHFGKPREELLAEYPR